MEYNSIEDIVLQEIYNKSLHQLYYLQVFDKISKLLSHNKINYVF